MEELDALLRLTYQANAGKRAPWKPLKIHAPHTEGSPVRREATPEEMLAIFGLDGGLGNGR